MKTNRGFIVPLLLGLIALLAVGGGVYIYQNKEAKAPASIDTNVEQSIQTDQEVNTVSSATSILNRKTYTNTKQGYSFQYPEKLSLSTEGEVVNLSHSIPFENRDGGCDMKGDSELSKILEDFGLSIKIVAGVVNPPYVDGTYSKGELSGKWAYTGAEGCGVTTYYFPIAGNKTLVVTKSEIQILSSVVTKEVRDKVLAVPGVISYEESKTVLDQILLTFKFDSSSNSKVSITTPALLQGDAYVLARNAWGDCTQTGECQKMTVTISKQGEVSYVTAIYEGLHDDSTGAQKKVAPAYYTNGTWILGKSVITQQCWPGRGHQDFSSGLCL